MDVEVITAQGKLLGVQREGHQVFRGVPFAAAPTDARRFASPAPPRPWAGVRAAQDFGRSAPQPQSTGVGRVGPQDEDCLYLNVYTPAADADKRPVMCFIHGGAFYLGASAEDTYDGGPLTVRGDVVVVTLNYRLGALGFLYLGGHGGGAWGATANAGLLDQVAALRWVRDNIAAFGGDPRQVTLFGQSAGAFSVCSLLAIPGAEGLFQRAIVQSGHGSLACPPETASGTATRWLQGVGVPDADPQALRALSVRRILEAQAPCIARDLRAFAPVADGDVLPVPPLGRVRAGGARGIPLLIGTNRDETRLYMDPKRSEIDHATLMRRATRIARGASDARVSELVETYRASRAARGLPRGNNDIVDALSTAARYRISALHLAEAQASQQPRTFVYEFTWASPAYRGTMGAAHALELPFVFGTLGTAMTRLTGTDPELVPLSHRMMDAWLAFARTGDPSCEAVGAWPRYDAETRPTMVFDLDTRVEHAPFEEERTAWAGLLEP